MMKIKLYYNTSWLSKGDYSKAEEAQIYEQTLKDLEADPRWFLEHLDEIPEYRVFWKSYQHGTATLPYKYVKKTKGL